MNNSSTKWQAAKRVNWLMELLTHCKATYYRKEIDKWYCSEPKAACAWVSGSGISSKMIDRLSESLSVSLHSVVVSAKQHCAICHDCATKQPYCVMDCWSQKWLKQLDHGDVHCFLSSYSCLTKPANALSLLVCYFTEDSGIWRIFEWQFASRGERGLKDREWGWVELGFTEGARYGRARCPLARDQLRDLEKCCKHPQRGLPARFYCI